MSKQKVPVGSQISWAAVAAQLTFLGFLVLIYYLLRIKEPMIWAALTYLTLSYGLRGILTKEHNKGMRLTKELNFAEAIKCYEKSADYFKNNQWIDRYRFITLFSSSRMTYREMALNNIAFCYSQMGEGAKAKEYYEKTLREFPNNIFAKAAMNMMQAANNSSDS